MPSPQAQQQQHQPRDIVIIGGGLIGVSTAYYLSRHPDLHPESKITLVEQDNVGTGSSGYASGLSIKGKDALSAEGFDLHRELSRNHGGNLKWGYKEIDLYSSPSHPALSSSTSMSTSTTTTIPFLPSIPVVQHRSQTAICQPSDLTRHLCGLFLTHPGASLVIARATSCVFEDEDPSFSKEGQGVGGGLMEKLENHTPCVEKIAQFFTGGSGRSEGKEGAEDREKSMKVTNEKSDPSDIPDATWTNNEKSDSGRSRKPSSPSGSPNSSRRGRRVKGLNVVRVINGVEEIVHLKADDIVLSPGIELPQLSKILFGQHVNLNMNVGIQEWEGVVLKPREKVKPLAVRLDLRPESKSNSGTDLELAKGNTDIEEAGKNGMGKGIEMVVRDDGKVVISRPRSQRDSSISTSPSRSPSHDIYASNVESTSLLGIIESLSPRFKASNGTLVLSKSTWSTPIISGDSPLFGKFPDRDHDQDRGRGSGDGVEGVWYGIGGKTVQAPAIGSKLASRIMAQYS
ncbi:uncharacterized protein I303_106854 [Kwoniella dejecticola CBS 10117]|uniref:FAD dependent oxidoreductase domain-containing protein n=1 Tax=Kwoniella dejecticola CBS 10117 TaxID=1296121 RepID=A0A1A5ZTI5_9TREE|nr:uncharacterized protein I303_08505 [Kwoniella dejecticola CBS 10117]OBR81122.1 hypothetical protein I303_08505 [Kwoniella dejecticola CBS 10117]